MRVSLPAQKRPRASASRSRRRKSRCRWRCSSLPALFAKSLSNITRVDLGLKTERLVVFGVAPMLNGYPPARNHEIFGRIEERLRQLPGVTGVTSSMVRLASGDAWGSNFTVEGFPADPDTDTQAMYTYVGSDYLRTLGSTLLFGPGNHQR